MKKFALTLLLLTCIFGLYNSNSFAAKKTREEMNIDETISDQSNNQYAQPTNIWISRVYQPISDQSYSADYWYKILYYYYITRLGYADFPYTYLIDRDGNIIEGRSGGIGIVPETFGDIGGISIGYLSNTSDLTYTAEQSFKTLVSDLSYKYGIRKDSVRVVKMIAVKSEKRTTKTKFEDDKSQFRTSVKKVTDVITYSDKEHIAYKGEVVELNYSKSVKAGEKIKVDVSIRNIDSSPWFTNRDFIYVTTTNFKDSPFAINGVWDSFSQPVAISKKTVLPNEVINLSFELQALLLPGKRTASFQLVKAPKNIISNTRFDLGFEITKGDFKLVQVKDTPGGFLNVRTCPSPNCETFGRIEDGKIAVMLEKSVGWYKIKYSDTKNGWVYGPYIQEL